MKKIKKLQIKPDRLLNNDELLALRGGYKCDFYWADYNWGYGYFSSQQDCDDFLDTYFDPLNYCSCS
ncbi:MAG TPA: hypothetical protein PK816_13330 [Candidatus Cloacimonadota bacterium]|jgi:hypothetical protein|nr:hypothetical protein [Candidatus Cloacimonadota bacterium]